MIFSDRKRPAAGTCKMPLSKRPKASEEASFAREEIKKQLKKMTRQVSCLLLGLRKGWLGDLDFCGDFTKLITYALAVSFNLAIRDLT